VTVTAGQRLTGSGTAGWLNAKSAGGTINFVTVTTTDLCYQANGGPLTNFSSPPPASEPDTAAVPAYVASASVVIPAAGTYTVGICVMSNNSITMGGQPTAAVSGWVIVSN
jgi:hypothetical protein